MNLISPGSIAFAIAAAAVFYATGSCVLAAAVGGVLLVLVDLNTGHTRSRTVPVHEAKPFARIAIAAAVVAAASLALGFNPVVPVATVVAVLALMFLAEAAGPRLPFVSFIAIAGVVILLVRFHKELFALAGG